MEWQVPIDITFRAIFLCKPPICMPPPTHLCTHAHALLPINPHIWPDLTLPTHSPFTTIHIPSTQLHTCAYSQTHYLPLYIHIPIHASPIYSYTRALIQIPSTYILTTHPANPFTPSTHTALPTKHTYSTTHPYTRACTHLYVLLTHIFHILRHVCSPHINIPMCMTHTQSWLHPATYTYSYIYTYPYIGTDSTLPHIYVYPNATYATPISNTHTILNLFLMFKKSFVIGQRVNNSSTLTVFLWDDCRDNSLATNHSVYWDTMVAVADPIL